MPQPRYGSRSVGRWLALAASTCCVAVTVIVAGAAPSLAAGTYSTTAIVNVRSGPGTGYPFVDKEPAGAQFTLQCQWQGGTNVNGNATWDKATFGYGAVSAASNPGSAWSWYCHWNITPQMQNAANWAISEKNSPNPAWSDHFGHYWSGWCEQFAEQAEGFQFSYGSALADYQAELNAGRIHTDTSPPVGALVFYGGGKGAGHVAVSIGNGQEIGTLGYVGDHYPVSQYAVAGTPQLSGNPYLGWALPFGS